MEIVILAVVIAVVIFIGLRFVSNRSRGSAYGSRGSFSQPVQQIDPGYNQPIYGEPVYVEPNPLAEITAFAAAEIAVDIVESAFFSNDSQMDSGGFDFDSSDQF